ncbi:hypothetical protein J7J81_02730 [bacterium]|nr:hypothetical protein [bacterium]
MEKEKEPLGKREQKNVKSREETKKQIILAILGIGAILLFWLLSSWMYK